ncbi:MAG: hypothetical protein KF841_10075 [Phycisphaerae bacterium]|nr:hypothetical protein [Phycisphaerae bacterium]
MPAAANEQLPVNDHAQRPTRSLDVSRPDGVLRRLAVGFALIAVASALCRKANGSSVLPTAIELTIQLSAAVGWLIAIGKAGQHARGDTFIAGLATIAGVTAATLSGRVEIIGLTVTGYVALRSLVDWLVDRLAMIETTLHHPRRLLRAIMPHWFGMVLFNGILLALPIATQSGVPDYRHNFLNHVLDSLFASVSAACLVGTTIQSFAEDYTLFGQAVLVATTQIAGMAFALLGLSIARPFLSRPLSALTILWAAVLCQIAAIVMMASAWHLDDASSVPSRIWWSIVYAGSALWNSGLAARTDGLAAYFADFRILVTVTTLAIVGSLGLPFLLDLILPQPRADSPKDSGTSGPTQGEANLSARLRRLPEFETLAATFLLATGAILLWYFEHPLSKTAAVAPARAMESMEDRVSLSDAPASQRWAISLLVSSMLRSAGIQSVPVSIGSISWFTFSLMLVLMFIGGSAAGVGGGVRTGIGTLWWLMRGTARTDTAAIALRRTLQSQIAKFVCAAVVINAAAVGACVLVTGSTWYESGIEATAAVGNVGFSTGLSLHLTPTGRFMMIGLYMVGRFGPVIFWLSVSDTVRRATTRDPDRSA